MDIPDWSTYSDDDMQALADAVATERQRRYVLSQAVSQGTALALEYQAAGGDVKDALAQIQAACNTAAAAGQGASDGTTPPV